MLLAFEGAVEEGTETVLRVLADLSAQITSDLQLGEKIRTLQTQSRAATWGCFALPYVVLLFLCATNSAYRQFFATPFGLVLVLIGAAFSVAGPLGLSPLVTSHCHYGKGLRKQVVGGDDRGGDARCAVRRRCGLVGGVARGPRSLAHPPPGCRFTWKARECTSEGGRRRPPERLSGAEVLRRVLGPLAGGVISSVSRMVVDGYRTMPSNCPCARPD